MKRWLAACMALWLGASCIGCGRYGPPRRSGDVPSVEAPGRPDPADGRPERRSPRR
jgi:hypothetical protein